MRALFLAAGVTVIVFAGAASRGFAQIPGSLPTPAVQQPDLMASLLAEVQALRAEVREAARVGASTQLLVARVQVQQLQLTRLDQQLALATARRLEAARERAEVAARLRQLDRRRTEQLSADERTAFEAERRQLRTELQERQTLEAQYRRQETELTEALSTEESQLRELTARLGAIESF